MAEAENPEPDLEEEFTDIPDGEPFQPSESGVVLGRTEANVIVFGGAHRSGKTTFIASLYERFVRSGTLARYSFVHSRTLVGFERLCFLGRITSELNSPEMPRTSKLHGRPIYHLELAREPYEERKTVLLCDVPGEHFDELHDGEAELEELRIVGTADRFVLLIDGAKIAVPRTRHAAADRAKTTLRALTESELLHDRSKVDVVMAKWDAIQMAGDAAVTYATECLNELCSDVAGRVAEVVGEQVAARASEGGYAPAHGADPMFERWISGTRSATEHQRTPVKPTRQMDRFSCV